MSRLKGKTGYLLLAGAIVINICLQGMNFFSVNSIGALLATNLPLLMAALAQAVIMAAGGIDISIGNTMALSNGVVIVCYNLYGISFAGSVLIAVLSGAAVERVKQDNCMLSRAAAACDFRYVYLHQRIITDRAPQTWRRGAGGSISDHGELFLHIPFRFPYGGAL